MSNTRLSVLPCLALHTALVTAVGLALPIQAAAQSAFGSPIVNQHAPANQVVSEDRRVVTKLPVVSETERAIAAITAANASGAQVVTLPYGEHKTYSIPLRPGMFTTFVLPKAEPIQQFAVNDPGAVMLNVNPTTNTAMLKLNTSVTVVGTIVTTKHTFYLEVTPAGRNDPWYQGVSWAFGTEAFGASSFGGGVFSPSGAVGSAPGGMAAPSSALPDPANDIYTGTPNFDYVIDGKASFKPVSVWDNGRFTWIQFKKNVQELPALFVDGPNGLEIVNYTVHADGTQLLVNRLMPRFVLKLGKVSITVTAGRDD